MFGSAPSDRALKISGDKRDAAITDDALRVAIDSPNMKDKAGVLGKGEQLRLSWRMAKIDVADNNFAMIGLRGTNGTDYKTATNTFFGMASNANRDITFMNGLGRWYWSQDQWYQYDLVLTEGKNTADLYINGFLAGANKEFTTKLPEGYTFCGLDGQINFVIKHDHWDKDVCMYMDDYKLVKHDADHPFVSGVFSDDFSNFTGRNAVSYTHLDVYKRQGSGVSGAAPENRGRRCGQGDGADGRRTAWRKGQPKTNGSR